MDKDKAHQIADQIIDNSIGLAVLTALASVKLRNAIAEQLIAAYDKGKYDGVEKADAQWIASINAK